MLYHGITHSVMHMCAHTCTYGCVYGICVMRYHIWWHESGARSKGFSTPVRSQARTFVAPWAVRLRIRQKIFGLRRTDMLYHGISVNRNLRTTSPNSRTQHLKGDRRQNLIPFQAQEQTRRPFLIPYL